MRINKFFLKYIVIVIICIALCFAIYPFYIRWITGNYAKRFSVVLNSHDMKRYDSFFSKDTIFELDGKQIKYVDVKENMGKMQAFTSTGSYGHLRESYNYKDLIMSRSYTVSFYLPIYDCPDRGNMFIGGYMILKRKWLFLFDIEKIIFDEEGEGESFLKDFLGI